jgi:hypothetical protein
MLQRTAHQVHPCTSAILLARLDHLERLVEDSLSRLALVNDLDEAVGEREAAARRVAHHRYPPAERKLDEDAPAQRVRDVVIPE